MNYIFKSKVDNHQQIKEQLLQQINLIPNNPIMENGQNIFHTDYNLPRTMHREYISLFLKTVDEHLKRVSKSINTNKYEVTGLWFQRYKRNGHHPWHTHAQTHFSNVYFLECPKGVSTKFIDFNKECEEGDILTFPAFLPHMSPPIQDDVIKTVIAFNVDFIM